MSKSISRIALVGLRLAQIPGRARAAHHDAREAPGEGVVEAHDADVDVALLEDAVLGQQALDVVEHLQERIAPGVDVVDQLGRQILVHAADAEILGVHARARGALVEHHQLLALLEAPERRRQRADVHGLRRDVQEMREMAADLGIEHADELGAPRHRDPQQLLGGEAEGVLLVHRRDVVEPVEVADGLQVGLVLDQLLGAAMEQADVRIDALDHLAVELEHEAQHAVRGRMLRPEVDVEGADLGLGHRIDASIMPIGATPARLAFSLTRALNRAHGTIMRSWRPSPISLDAVMRLDLEGDAPPVDGRAFGIDRHGLAGHVAATCETSMWMPSQPSPHRDALQELEARPLHQAHHEAGREHGRHHLEVVARDRDAARSWSAGTLIAELSCRADLERRPHGLRP